MIGDAAMSALFARSAHIMPGSGRDLHTPDLGRSDEHGEAFVQSIQRALNAYTRQKSDTSPADKLGLQKRDPASTKSTVDTEETPSEKIDESNSSCETVSSDNLTSSEPDTESPQPVTVKDVVIQLTEQLQAMLQTPAVQTDSSLNEELASVIEQLNALLNQADPDASQQDAQSFIALLSQSLLMPANESSLTTPAIQTLSMASSDVPSPTALLPMDKPVAQSLLDTPIPLSDGTEMVASPTIESTALPLAQGPLLANALPTSLSEVSTTSEMAETTATSNASETPASDLMAQVGKILEQAPPEATEALKAAISELKTATQKLSTLPGKPLAGKARPRNIEQLRFEAAIDRSGVVRSESAEAQSESFSATLASVTEVVSPSTASASPTLTVLASASTLGVNDALSSASAAAPSSGNPLEGLTNGLNTLQGAADLDPHEQVVSAAKLTVQAGRKEMTLKLMPNELGEVRMMLSSNAQGQVTARLVTETLEAKQALQSTVDQLVKSLEESGVKIARIAISQAGEAPSQNSAGQQDGESSRQQQQQSSNQNTSGGWQQQRQTGSEFFFGDQQPSSEQPKSAFTDEGISSSNEEGNASSDAFDTDVEGEEVSLSRGFSGDSLSAVDLRI